MDNSATMNEDSSWCRVNDISATSIDVSLNLYWDVQGGADERQEKEKFLLEVMQMAQIAPEAKHMINIDALARFKADAAALPYNVMNTKEEIQEKVAIENAQRQQMMQLEMADKAAGAAQKGATAMDKAGLILDPNNPEAAQVAQGG